MRAAAQIPPLIYAASPTHLLSLQKVHGFGARLWSAAFLEIYQAQEQHVLPPLPLLLQVHGFGARQWSAFLEVYRAQEQHVLHLVQPVWDSPDHGFRVLWEQLGSTPAAGTEASVKGGASSRSAEAEGPTAEEAAWGDGGHGGRGGCYSALLRYVRVPLSRCCFHSTVSVRRLGLSGLLGLNGHQVAALMQVKGRQGGCRDAG